MPQLTLQEIRRMFDDFDLDTDDARARFRSFEESRPTEGHALVFTRLASSTDPETENPEVQDAELA